MGKILSLLSEIRQEQLITEQAEKAKYGLPFREERFQESKQFFEYAGKVMTGIKPTDTGNAFREVMTSGDFDYAIQEFVQRLMIPGYQRKVFNFEQFIKPETTPNLMEVTRYQSRSGVDDLEYVGEKGTPRPGSVDDLVPRRFRVYRFEKQYDFSMEAFINDDLGYFESKSADFGFSARRSLEKFVSRMMWNAVTTARLIALGALFSTTGRLTTARISQARMAFNQRVDTRGEPIAASLKHLIYHPGLADTVAQIQASTLVAELATNGVNVVRGTFNPIEDPYAPGVAPNLPWFAMTDWNMGVVPFILARWSGRPAPILTRTKSNQEIVGSLMSSGTDAPPILGDFHTANIEYAVRDIWGTYIDTVTDGNMFDTNGCYYSSGTAP